MLNKNLVASMAILFAVVIPAHGNDKGDNRAEMGTDAEGNAYFIETDTMTRKGFVVYAWQQVNRAQPDSEGALFVRSQLEFDCKYLKSRTMWKTLQTEHDGKGTTISSAAISNPEWVAAEDGSFLGKMREFSCLHVFRTKATLM